MSTKKLDGYTPTNAMIACCNGTGDYIKRADYEKLEKENEQLRLEADRQTEIADAMTVYAGNDASTIKEIVAIKNENEQLRKVSDELASRLDTGRRCAGHVSACQCLDCVAIRSYHKLPHKQ